MLLPSIVVFEEKDGGSYASGKALPFLLEEMISRGISEIIIFDRWRYESVLPNLPSIFSKAIHFSKSTRQDDITATNIFSSFFDEFGLEVIENGAGVRHTRQSNLEEETTIHAGLSVWFSLPAYLTASREKSHCHFDVKSFLKNLDKLRNGSRSPETRANAAVLQGIFSNYQSLEHGSLKTNLNSAASMIGLFEELLDSPNYKSLSQEVGMLGEASKNAHEAKRNIFRLVKVILKSKIGKGILDYGSTVVSVATGVPLPKSNLAEGLLRDRYFPPIVDISDTIKTASGKMLAAYPDSDFLSATPRSKKR
jgi:hypothetical protein